MNMELDFVREMFDNIAPKYDVLNRLLSLRQDVMWRREMVRAGRIPRGGHALDVACGTCDVALEIRRQTREQARVTGTDFSPGMLVLGQKKIKRCGDGVNIPLVAGNALALPFKQGIFDAVFIAFGIRNIMDRKGALAAFFTALKPGGRVVVLELTSPETGIFHRLYLTYFQRVLPLIGALFSKNNHAYHYLPASVMAFPDARQFARTMGEAGFTQVRWKKMTLGIVTLFVGVRPTL